MLANLITLARLPLAAGFALVVALVAQPSHPAADPALHVPALSMTWAVVLLCIAAAEELTDFLDGFVARKTGTVSRLGAILDPLADSLARLTMYYAMALAGWITIVVPLAMTLRDIVVAYTRVVQASTGGKTAARVSGKLKALIQGAGLFAVVLIAACVGRLDHETERLLQGLVAAAIIGVTSWSLLDYIHGAAAGLRKMQN